MEIYLDNAATTSLCPEAFSAMQEVFNEEFGNPSSLHIKGVNAAEKVKNARKVLADELKCAEKEIVFTSGGTESNNMALIGTALANSRRGKHIISSSFEHASVYNPLLYLEKSGFEISFIKPDENGNINPSELASLVREDTILISIMMVNNEVGSLIDIEALSKAAKAVNPEVIFHVDAIQAFPKYKIVPKKLGIDLMSASSHKFRGPKGCGFIYIKDKTHIIPIIYGGGQQKNMRSGTENVPGIVGMSVAAKKYADNRTDYMNHMYELKYRFVTGIKKINEELFPDGKEKIIVNAIFDMEKDVDELMESIRKTAPHIISVSFPKAKSEVFLHVLEMKGIFVSSGSACSSNHPAISGTLKAIGVADEYLDSTLRFSLCPENTEEEIDYVLKTIKEELPTYMQFFRK